MNENTLRQAVARYGLLLDEIGPAASGYRNAVHPFRSRETWYALVLYKAEPDSLSRIRRTNMLGTQLAEAGLPVRQPVDTRILSLQKGAATRYAGLYSYLPGETIPWEAYTRKHIKLLGWGLAAFHEGAVGLATGGFPSVTDEYADVLRRMATYFDEPAIRRAMSDKLGLRAEGKTFDRLSDFLQGSRDLKGAQILHMDFVRGNALFAAESHESRFAVGDISLSGIIDLEKAAAGHPLFDVARTLAFLLVDCSVKTPRDVYHAFLDSGYIKRGGRGLSPVGVKLPGGVVVDLLDTAISLFLLYDFYKFLRSNPYESLRENHHYVRTRDILLARRIIKGEDTFSGPMAGMNPTIGHPLL